MKEYVLMAQDEPLCERFIRQADGLWGHSSYVGLDAVLEFTSNPARMPLSEIYAGIDFDEVAKSAR